MLSLLHCNFQHKIMLQQIREKLMSRDSTSVIVVAHRGDWRNFLKIQLEAIDNAY